MKYKKRGNPLARIKLGRRIFVIGKKVKLREKKLSDARNDYAWQTDTELARLDAAPLLSMSFPFYLLQYSQQLYDFCSTRCHLAVVTLDDKHIGNCSCYDIKEAKGEAQMGIMIGDRNYWDEGYGSDTMTTFVDHVFGNTDLKRVYLKTLEWNKRAQKCFEKCGFTPCGRLNRNSHNFVVMELTRPQWEKRRESQSDVLQERRDTRTG